MSLRELIQIGFLVLWELSIDSQTPIFLRKRTSRKANDHSEKQEKQAFRRDLRERADSYPDFKTEFGHLEGDTIVGEKQKSAVITLVERCSKSSSHWKPMDGKQVILRLILINGCLKSLATFLSLQLLIVGKNFLIGNLFPMRMTLIFSLRVHTVLVNGGSMNILMAY